MVGGAHATSRNISLAMPRRPSTRSEAIATTELRIIGGKLRGSKFYYNGDPGTRPMKERVREAAFNLIGPAIKGSLAIDLFAGTGALGLEALSRGAAEAMFIERHRPTARTLLKNIGLLGVADRCEVIQSDTFFWARGISQLVRDRVESGSAANVPWMVFCSPPYALYADKSDEMLKLIHACQTHAPVGSAVVVEADNDFDFSSLPAADSWDVREYSPAVLAIWRVAEEGGSEG